MKKIIENPENAEWKAVKKFVENSIKQFQLDLERFSPENETAMFRGKIAFARQILQLDNKSTNIEVVDIDYGE